MPNPKLKKLTFVDNSTSPPTSSSYDIGADITVDEEPIEDSTNPISSGAVYNSLCGISDILELLLSGQTYLTFTGTAPFTLQTYNTSENWDGTLEYSTDTKTWTTWTGTEISSSNNKLYLRGTDNTYLTGDMDSDYRFVFTTTGTVACTGNIMNLLDYNKVMNNETITMASCCFMYMFYDCTALTTAPELPATALVDYCYSAMFYGCTALTTAPELPATTLAESCYEEMFNGCTALTTAPELPATTMNYRCYYGMFQNCTALTTPPVLPATTLDTECYRNMFYGCTSIKLSSTLTGDYLKAYRIPTEGTGTNESYALENMFANTGGTFTGTPTINTTYYLAARAYVEFTGTSSFTLKTYNTSKNWDGTLEYSTDTKTWTTWTGTEISSSNNKLYLRGTGNTKITRDDQHNSFVFTTTGTVACTGNIMNLLDYNKVINNETINMGEFCFAYMFYGCTSLTTPPELPATTLVESCYNYMFYGCTSLTKAPELPATTLATLCYAGMFQNCTTLTTPPELSATTLASGCYNYMFGGCTSLTKAPELPATTLVTFCYTWMFQGCTSLTTPPELPATTLATYCYAWMFQGCTSIKLSTTLTGDYVNAYRIPTTGTGTDATNSVTDMFSGTGGTFTGTPSINTVYYYAVGEPPAPVSNPYIEFVGTAPFTLRQQDDWKSWDGTMEYSNDGVNWYEWNPEVTSTIYSSDSNNTYILQLRGTNNTKLCAEYGSYSAWVISSDGTVECNGNIMNLLDYQTVSAGNEPQMDDENGFTFSGLFADCQALTKAPDLPAMNLVYGCYESMFSGCENLVTPPSVLPATTLQMECYENMFAYCTSLESTPAFPDVLTIDGYDSCLNMFNGCDVLNTLPAIPNVDANSSSDLGLGSMFSYCPLIKISETQTGEYQNAYRIPAVGTASNNIDTSDMFSGTGGTFTGTPSINTTYYTSNTIIPASS